jgi:hypothetical protein
MSAALSLRHFSLPIAEVVSALSGRLAVWMRPRPVPAAQAAAYLRRLASQFEDQPGFAADLRAAADRHEQENGIQ